MHLQYFNIGAANAIDYKGNFLFLGCLPIFCSLNVFKEIFIRSFAVKNPCCLHRSSLNNFAAKFYQNIFDKTSKQNRLIKDKQIRDEQSFKSIQTWY